MKLVYIAGPFRGPTTWDIAQNVRAAEALGLDVAKCGYMPVIPHANTALFNGQCTEQFWLDGTLLLLSRCDALITLPIWERSSGAKAEVEFAKVHSIPVCQIFGGALNLPKNVSYIPFDLATVFQVVGIDPDVSREEFAELKEDDLPQHNALRDARVQLACYQKLATVAEENKRQGSLTLNL